jgi:2-methylisocitrate lyase-like PEP mutase family enzyme
MSAAVTPSLRDLLAAPGLLVVPGGGTPFDMLMAKDAGFPVAFLSGNAMAMARYGVPDVGVVGLAEVTATVEAIRETCEIALMVDCDTGYGEIARTVEAMENLGVASIQIEDQAWPKRCGHLAGIEVEARDVAVRRVGEAIKARSTAIIVARTDARSVKGFEEALLRARLFRSAGADLLMVSGLKTVDEWRRLCDAAIGPQVVAITETVGSPVLPAADLERIGFKIALWPTTATRVGAHYASAFYRHLKAAGSSREWLDRMISIEDANRLTGLARYDSPSGGTSSQ